MHRFSMGNRQIGGVAGGPHVLARAGLPNGYHFTLHWEYAPALAEEFPKLDSPLTLLEFDRDRLTSSGSTAPPGMMHAFVVREHRHELVRMVSDWLLQTDLRIDDQPQRVALSERLKIHSPPLLKAIEPMETQVEVPLARAEIAASTGVLAR